MKSNSVEFFKKNKYQLPEQLPKPILIAYKLRTPENYGNLLRLADNIGFLKVLFIESDAELSQRKIRKTAGDSYYSIPFEFVKEQNWLDSIPENYNIVALETVETSSSIYNTKLPDNFALIVGNEKKGINTEILLKCELKVHIPLTGNCTSLNVSHATAIAAFEWLRQKL